MINCDKYCGHVGHDVGARILTPQLAPIIMDLIQKIYKKHYIPMIKGLNSSSLALVAGFVKMSATLSSVGTYSNFTVPACISDLK